MQSVEVAVKNKYKSLTRTLAGSLCADYRRKNRLCENYYRWIHCIFFVINNKLLSSVLFYDIIFYYKFLKKTPCLKNFQISIPKILRFPGFRTRGSTDFFWGFHSPIPNPRILEFSGIFTLDFFGIFRC